MEKEEKGVNELRFELEELQQKYNGIKSSFEKEEKELKETIEELKVRLLFFEGIANSTFDGFLVVGTDSQKILQTQRTIDLWKIPKEVVEDPSGLKQVDHVMYMTVNPKQFVDEINYQREHPDEKRLDVIELIDGTILERYSSPVYNSEGKHYGRIWTFHDITEQKRFEEQLNRLNADKDRFISVLAHDLRSPFNSILGLTEVLKENLSTLPNDELQTIINSLNSISKKTFELLEDTLLWANAHSNKISFLPKPIDVHNTLDEILEILTPVASTKEIRLKNSSQPDLEIVADLYMFKALIRNLVSNAIKFSNKGGIIKVLAIPTESETTLSVSDTGVGIPPGIASKLFSFSNIQSTTGTNGEPGSGLGLILCKSFVDKHGGKIWVESKENVGTTVCFTIPHQLKS
jgi:signal transduction histidine kinase